MKRFLPKVALMVLGVLLVAGVSAGTVYLITGRPLAARAPASARRGMYSAGEFTTNLAPNESKTKYIRVKVELEIADEKSLDVMAEQQAIIRDRILEVLRSKTVHEVTGEDGMQTLGRAILVRLNDVLKNAQVTNVYFTDFVVQ